MKFRCERDLLVEALGTAGRAATNRGGALPVLSGVRLELSGGRLLLTGTDLELTISVEATGRRPGRRHRRAPRAHRVRGRAVARARRRHRHRRRRRGPHLRRALPVLDPVAARRRVPAPPGARRAGRHPRSGRPRGRAAPGRPGGQWRRLPTHPHRCAVRRRGRWPPPGGHRLVPAVGARPPGHQRPARRPDRAGAVTCPQGGRAAARLGQGAHVAPRRARGHLRDRRRGRAPGHAPHHAPHRGRVPQLPRPRSRRATPTASPWVARRCSTRSAA